MLITSFFLHHPTMDLQGCYAYGVGTHYLYNYLNLTEYRKNPSPAMTIILSINHEKSVLLKYWSNGSGILNND